MSVRIYGALFGAISLLSACDAAGTNTPTQDALTTTGFVAPSATGVINIGLEGFPLSRVAQTFPNSGVGYAFQAGSIANEGLFAVAGVLPGTESALTLPPVGSATYSGTYNLVEVSNVSLGSQSITGSQNLRSGTLDLAANFANNTLVSIGGGALSVNGRVESGNEMTGTVSYGGVSGDLGGFIGGNRAIGAFHGEGNVGPGSDDDYMYAGGFIAARN